MPSVRSRLWASGFAFALGFAIANLGILGVVGPDRWVLIGVAAVLMLTGAVGVLVADTTRRLSWWAVVGLELLVVFVALPLLWTLTVAGSTGDAVPRDLWPGRLDGSAFRTVLDDAVYRRATTTAVLLALVVAVVSVLLAAPAAYALARRRVPLARWVHGAFVAALVAPVLTFALPWADQLRDLGAAGARWATLVPLLLVGLPLALWLSLTVMRRAPWALHDVVRADGATRWQQLRLFALPVLGPGLALVAVVVFVVVSQDVVVGAALTTSDGARPLPATLLLGEAPPSVVAAAGLFWLVPALLVLVVAPRRTALLVGRTTR